MEMSIVSLEKGFVEVYDFGKVKLHAYKTNDFIDDEVILLEKNSKLIVIESPVFFDNIKELENYINRLNVTVEGELISYHVGGGTFLKNVKKYITKNAEEYGYKGEGKGLIEKFTGAFGKIFDSSFHKITDYIEEGTIKIADIELRIILTDEAYDIEIPEINCIYTHMLGADCHSIVAGEGHAKTLIGILKEYVEKNYNLILTSHYVPEKIEAVKIKIEYLEMLISTAKESSNAKDFKEKVQEKTSNYSGENYLEMTAGMFFPQN